MNDNASPHLSELALDRVVAGSMAPPEHLSHCDDCARLLAERKAELAAFQARPVPGFVVHQITSHPERVRSARASRRIVLGLFGTFAAAAIALFASVPGIGTSMENDVRAKGAAAPFAFEALVMRHGEDRAGPVGSDMTVASGDTLQWVASLQKSAWFSLVTRDGAGLTQRIHPRDTPTELLSAGSSRVLGTSYTLDDTPGVEHFAAIFCDANFDPDAIVSEMRAVADANLGAWQPTPRPGCVIVRLAFTKTNAVAPR